MDVAQPNAILHQGLGPPVDIYEVKNMVVLMEADIRSQKGQSWMSFVIWCRQCDSKLSKWTFIGECLQLEERAKAKNLKMGLNFLDLLCLLSTNKFKAHKNLKKKYQ